MIQLTYPPKYKPNNGDKIGMIKILMMSSLLNLKKNSKYDFDYLSLLLYLLLIALKNCHL